MGMGHRTGHGEHRGINMKAILVCNILNLKIIQSTYLIKSILRSMYRCISIYSPCLCAHLSPLLVGVEVGVAAPDHPLRVALGLHVAVRRRPGQAGRGECVLTSGIG